MFIAQFGHIHLELYGAPHRHYVIQIRNDIDNCPRSHASCFVLYIVKYKEKNALNQTGKPSRVASSGPVHNIAGWLKIAHMGYNMSMYFYVYVYVYVCLCICLCLGICICLYIFIFILQNISSQSANEGDVSCSWLFGIKLCCIK